MIDHRLLHRMQVVAIPAETLNGDEFFAIKCWQELYARVNGSQRDVVAIAIKLSQHDSAGTAITFGAPFFCACSAQVFTQKLQHRTCRIYVIDFDDLAIEHKPNAVRGRDTHPLQLPL
jgi:hypothetical protein